MRKALLAAGVLAVALPAGAHDTWVLPVRWNVPVRERLVLDLTSAMDFPTPETAARPDRLVDKSIRLNGVVSSLEVSPPRTGAKTLRLSARPTAVGLATVWIATRPRTLDLKPDEVEHYLEEIGAVDTVGEQWRRSPDKAWRETYVKVAKTFVRVGDTQNDESWSAAVGASLELVPASDPTALSSGHDLAFLLLSNGKPIADLAVGAVAAASAKPLLVKTDAEGRVTFRLDRSGPWLFRATLIRPVAGRHGEWESVFTTVTVDVTPAPAPTRRAAP
jgi:uncharacterized GH25 family protein